MAWPGARPTYAALAARQVHTEVHLAPMGLTNTLANVARDQPMLHIDTPPGIPLPDAVLGSFSLGLGQLGASRNPQIGMFFRDSGLTAGTLGTLQLEYIPDFYPDGRIGRFVIGKSAVGYRRHTHKRVTLGVAGAGEAEPP